MNVSEQVKNVNAECHPNTDIDAIIIRWLNQGQKVIESKAPEKGWFWLRQWDYILTTVQDQEEYTLSPLVNTAKIITFRDTTSPRLLDNWTAQHFYRFEPGPTSTGEAYNYRIVGFSPVQKQPSSASPLRFTSDDAGDTTQTVNVQGLDTNGILVQEPVALTGTTPVSTNKSYTKVMSLSKDAVTDGNVTVDSNGATVTNVVLSPYTRSISHPVIKLYNIPGDARDLYYDFIMKLPDLVGNNDISLVPERYHDVIELYAKHRCFKHLNNPTMAQLTFQEFLSRIEDMIQDQTQPNTVWGPDDFEPESTVAEAQLPAMFPRC